MTKGWIKLHRKLLDNDAIFRGGATFPLFCLLLLLADRNGIVKTGRLQLANQLKMNESTVYKTLKKLEKMGTIEINSNNKYSVIYISNWEVYQGKGNNDISETPKGNNKVTTKEQQSNSKSNNKYLSKNDQKEQPENQKVTTFGAKGNTYTRNKNKNKEHIYKKEVETLLLEIIEIINPKERVTKPKLSSLEKILKDYSPAEVLSTAKDFSQSQWHKENGFMTVSTLLRPTKFDEKFAKTLQTNHTNILDLSGD